MFFWKGTYDSNFDDGRNWQFMGFDYEGELYHEVPISGDSFNFTTYSNPCSNMHGPTGGGQYNVIIFQSWYASTVTLAAGFSTRSLFLYGGTISQPSSGTDITVTEGFTWTGGTLNSSSHRATVFISGSSAAALIAPASGGTVSLGSNLTLANGADATMREGTINMTNDGLTFIVNSNSVLLVPPDLGNNVNVTGNVALQGGVLTVENGGKVDVQSKTLSLKGRCVNSGTFIIREGARAVLSGQPTQITYVQEEAGETFVYGGAALEDGGLGDHGIVLAGGRLVAKNSGQTAETMATIISPKGVFFTGVEVSITPDSGFFGTLKINGDLTWGSGTFKPRVQGHIIEGQDFAPSDQLMISGKLIFPGNTTAHIAPVPLDSDGGELIAAESGNYWRVVDAVGTIFGLGGGPQLVDLDSYTYFTEGLPITRIYVRAN